MKNMGKRAYSSETYARARVDTKLPRKGVEDGRRIKKDIS